MTYICTALNIILNNSLQLSECLSNWNLHLSVSHIWHVQGSSRGHITFPECNLSLPGFPHHSVSLPFIWLLKPKARSHPWNLSLLTANTIQVQFLQSFSKTYLKSIHYSASLLVTTLLWGTISLFYTSLWCTFHTAAWVILKPTQIVFLSFVIS